MHRTTPKAYPACMTTIYSENSQKHKEKEKNLLTSSAANAGLPAF